MRRSSNWEWELGTRRTDQHHHQGSHQGFLSYLGSFGLHVLAFFRNGLVSSFYLRRIRMGVSGYGFSYLMYWIGLVFDLWCLGWKHTMEMDGSRTDKLQIIIILSGLGRGIRDG